MVASCMRMLSCYVNWTSESGRNCMLPADLSHCLSRYEVAMVVPNAILKDIVERFGEMVARDMKILSCYVNRTFGSGRKCMLPADLSHCLSRYEVAMGVPNAILKI